MSEKSWVHELVPRIGYALKKFASPEIGILVSDGSRLAYSCVINEYDKDNKSEPISSKYETDLLICDSFQDGRWIPRVVVECKIGGSVTTHDALTYSSKAATHKQVHPYLRYGFLAGERKHYAIPPRLVKHGAQFDFMATWCAAEPTAKEWKQFCELLKSEIQASRLLQQLLVTNRSLARTKYSVLHRPLVLK
ncbi:MAG TPA: hypothetical protein VN643_10030 [Pyrinomonadaceae bacterium]|nr:hypothetical protein [Pyrinomonadaceae bacterium]